MSTETGHLLVQVFRTDKGMYRVAEAGKAPQDHVDARHVLEHLQEMFHRLEGGGRPAEAARAVPARAAGADLPVFNLDEARAAAGATPSRDALWEWAQGRFWALGDNWLEGFRAGLYRLALHDRGEGYMTGYQAGRALNHALHLGD